MSFYDRNDVTYLCSNSQSYFVRIRNHVAMLSFGLLLLLLSITLAAASSSLSRPISGPLSSASADYTPFDSTYQLVWSDEFNQTDGSAPDPSVWNLEVSGDGEGNHELEYYTSSINNSYIDNGRLHIVGRQQQYKGHNYTSARIDSQGKVEVLYGLIAARARISMYDGYWPAFWLIGSQASRVNWPRCGEMDIMEQVNGRGTGTSQDDSLQFGTLHYNQYGINSTKVNHLSTGGIVKQKPNHYCQLHTAHNHSLTHSLTHSRPPPPMFLLTPITDSPQRCSDIVGVCVAGGDDFHLYQALWTNTTYTFMVDDLAYETVDLTSDIAYDSFHDPTNPFFFIINLALGGDFPRYTPTDGFPAHFELDWVRVWQQVGGGGGVWTKPLEWVEEGRRAVEEGSEAGWLQSKKVRDVSRYMNKKRPDDVNVVKMQ